MITGGFESAYEEELTKNIPHSKSVSYNLEQALVGTILETK